MPTLSQIFGSGLSGKLRSSFRVRLFTGITVVILIVCCSFATLLFYQQYQAQLDKRESEGSLMAKLLARDVRLAVFSGNRDEIILAAKGTMSLPEVQSVEIYDPEGLLIARLATPADDSARYSTFRELIPGLLNVELEKSLFVGKRWGSAPDAAIGSVRIVVDESKAEAHLHRLIITVLTATIIFITFGILAAYLLAKSMTRPIIELSECAAALKDGNDSVRAPIETSDEIGHLASSFNSMVDAIRLRTRDLEEALEELYQLNIALEDKVAKRTSQLENANRELESFNYSASHDLRAPLNRLTGFCEVLKEEYGDRLGKQGLHYIQRIASTGDQMNLVLSAMLTLYQVQQREMSPRPLDISELATAVAASLKQRESDRKVEFVIEPNIIVFADMKLIWLALENILGNAWKFTKSRDDAKIEFGRLGNDGETVCYVRDNGAGFNMEYYDKLFTPFQRLHNFEDFPGTGVGLAIVQRIISRHGGRIWLESNEGLGTTCYFVLQQHERIKEPLAEGNIHG
ncbi:MAG: HAMP domain-containing protein [Geobacteraceae bacterium]|nr:HAMP domain-containing protein [Geobacteraceae bacterium]